MNFLNDSFEDFASLVDDSDLASNPVDLDTFLFDPYYLGNMNVKEVSDIQRDIIETTSQIYKLETLVELYGQDKAQEMWDNNTVNELVCMIGKGGGKDLSSRIAVAYTVHKLHCLRDPLEYYGKARGTYVDILNIAVNAKQADLVFFQPLKNMLDMSGYFRDEVGYEPRRDNVVFDTTPVRLHSGNSEAEAWEGLDLFIAVLDEIAAFRSDDAGRGSNAGRQNAEAVYQMSKVSAMSRFPDFGKVILLSFPRFDNDFIMQRYDAAGAEAGVKRWKAPTWEVNPSITREMLEPEFRRNPVESEMRFACNPPTMIDAYFRDPARVRACFKGNKEFIDRGNGDSKEVLREIEEIIPVDSTGRLKDWFKPALDDEHMRYIHVDLGLKKDRAAICMAHSPGTRKIETAYGEFEDLPVVIMDLIYYWEATEGHDIDFDEVRSFVRMLSRRFPIGKVTLDRWQSLDTIAIFQKWGLRAEQRSVRTNDYDNLATLFYDGRFSGYFHDELVEQELLRLQLKSNGKVDHPKGFHDDLSQALAGAVALATQFSESEVDIEISVLGEEDWEDLEYDPDNVQYAKVDAGGGNLDEVSNWDMFSI